MDDRLQKFARLVETGSFTRAARDLHVSQPALTVAVHKLERELGAELLVRGNRQLELTEAGQAAYQAAMDQQTVRDGLQEALNRIAGKRPRVTLGMTDSLAAQLCAQPAFDDLESAAQVTVVVNNSRHLRQAVEERQVDIAFMIDDGLEHPGLIKQNTGTEQLVFVCAPQIIADVDRGIANGSLQQFISYDKPSTTYRHVQRALQERDIRTHTSLYSTSPEVMLQMVLRGKGVAALPAYLVQADLAAGRLITIDHCNAPLIVERPTCTLRLATRTLLPTLQEFISDTIS